MDECVPVLRIYLPSTAWLATLETHHHALQLRSLNASALKSVPSLAQRAPSSVTLRFAQGKPSVHHLRTVVLRQPSALSSLKPQLSINSPVRAESSGSRVRSCRNRGEPSRIGGTGSSRAGGFGNRVCGIGHRESHSVPAGGESTGHRKFARQAHARW